MSSRSWRGFLSKRKFMYERKKKHHDGGCVWETCASPAFSRIHLLFLLVFMTQGFSQKQFFSKNTVRTASFSFCLAGKMGGKNVMTHTHQLKQG